MSENYRPKSQPNVQRCPPHTRIRLRCQLHFRWRRCVKCNQSVQSTFLLGYHRGLPPVQPVSDSQIEIIKFIPQECSFVNKIKSFVSSFNNVYTKEKSSQLKQEVLDENVFPDFQQMWKFVGDLFVQNPDSAQISTMTSPTPEIVYKTIDFSKVNVRNMANIPKPSSCPVHGCSNDPKFYTEIVKLDSVDYYGRHYTSPCRHQTSAPFGSLFGYQTNDGIVPVPDTPVHGHVWSDQLRDWVLHAVFPDDCSPAPAPWRGTRSPTTRPPSTRRGWSTSRPRREGKGWRHRITETAPAASFIMLHCLWSRYCVINHQFNIHIQPQNMP